MATRKTKRKTAPKAKRTTKRIRKAAPPEPEVVDDEEDDEDAPPSSRQHVPGSEDRRLETILRALPERELAGLVKRMKIRVDRRKRIDAPAQVARALVRLPELREPSRLPGASEALLRRVAEANGALRVQSLPQGLELLVQRGVLYARVTEDEAIELLLPTAFLVQLQSWESEDPRALRALLSEAAFETSSAVAAHYLGRPSTPPVSLSLEPAWEVLGDPMRLRAEIEGISLQEKRLLEAIERVGGEVDTQELMDLEREPMRVRGVYGVSAGRRGAAFSLEKRGFLLPLHPNRYVVPTEVAAIIGAERRAEREAHRDRIRSEVIEEDHLPRRARFTADPAPFAVALTMAWHESGTEVKPNVGTPRSLVSRLANRFGREVEPTSLVVSLSRAIGLWEPEAIVGATPPGSYRLGELSHLLFETWRRGGAWDEAREEPEVLRVAAEHRDASPVGAIRELVLDSLLDLGEDRWVPLRALLAYVEEDPRWEGLERLLERWAERCGEHALGLDHVVQRILVQSLPTLGIVDLGGADVEAASGSGHLATVALRLTSRGRRTIAGHEPKGAETTFDDRDLVVGGRSRVADVLAVGPFTDMGSTDRGLTLVCSDAAIAAGLAHGVPADVMHARLEALTPLPEELSEALHSAGTVLGTGEIVPAGAFVWLEDDDVRRLLMSSPSTADAFVDPSPPGGLLVHPKVDPERLLRRCRALGVELVLDDDTLEAMRQTSSPTPKRSSVHKAVSWSGEAVKRSGTD